MTFAEQWQKEKDASLFQLIAIFGPEKCLRKYSAESATIKIIKFDRITK